MYNDLMGKLKLYLLGTFQATLEGVPITGFTYDKVRALFAYLAVEAHAPHHRESLATLLWSEDSPDAARTSLRKALSTLNQAIQNGDTTPPYLIIQRDQVQFNLDSECWLDSAILEAKLAAVDKHPHLQLESCSICMDHLEEAVNLYRGTFLEGLIVEDGADFEEWSLTRREYLHMRVLTALHYLTLHYLHRGKYSRAQLYALRQVEMEPYREEAHRALMTILARSGQHSAALVQYETCRRILKEELGVEPSQETQALYERIRSVSQVHPHNLPLPLPAIVGREAELLSISERIANPDCRLLTLVGVGGVGKTSLGLQVAQEQLGNFLHGVYWVFLGSVLNPEQILTAIINVLPITLNGSSEPKAQLLDYLRQKSILLVLDNFEHLLPSAHARNNEGLNLLNEILQTAPHVKLLITSRERLCLRAEWVFHLNGLAYPIDLDHADIPSLPDYAAIQLFAQRARQSATVFAPEEEDYLPIAHICKLLQGIPLGIELAAGQVDQHTCQAIAAGIESDLDFLVTSMRDVQDRHQSLRAVFDYSWKLLPAEDQAILRKLSVFQVSFNRVAAHQVGGATPYQLAVYVNKSFLSVDAAGRHALQPLLKQYLLEALAADSTEEETTRCRHAGFHASFLNKYEAALVVQHQMQRLAEVEEAIADFQAAWDWGVSRKDHAILADMLDGLYIYFWARNQFQEGRTLLEKASSAMNGLDQLPQTRLLLARIWSRLADFQSWTGDLAAAENLLRQSIDLLRSPDGNEELTFSLEMLGRVYYWQGDYPHAIEVLTTAIDSARKMEVQHHLAQALCTLATVICEETADYETVKNLYAESLTIYQKIDNSIGIAKVLINQGAIFYEQGDFEQAQHCYQRSLELYRQAGYSYGISAALNNLAIVSRRLGNYLSAKQLVEESLALKRETGNRIAILHSLLESAELSTEMGDFAAAHNSFCEAVHLALEAQTRGAIFDILVGVAALYHKKEKIVQAVEIVIWVLAQAGLGQETRTQAESLSAEMAKRLSAEELVQCRKRALQKDLDSILAGLGCSN